MALDQFEDKWSAKFPSIGQSWRRNWENVATLFIYPEAIRKVIYTRNAIESLNSVIRKSIKNRKIFNHDNLAFKIVFLAIESASKKWTMPIRDWNAAINQFMILHEERLQDYVKPSERFHKTIYRLKLTRTNSRLLGSKNFTEFQFDVIVGLGSQFLILIDNLE